MTERSKTSTPGRVTMAGGTANATEAHKAVVRQFIEGALNRTRPGEWEQAFHPEATMSHPMRKEPIRGVAAIKKFVEEFHRGFPDFRVRTVQMVAENHDVAFLLECQGTLKGEFAGHQPNNKHLQWSGANFATIRDGKIAAVRVCDTLAHHLKG